MKRGRGDGTSAEPQRRRRKKSRFGAKKDTSSSASATAAAVITPEEAAERLRKIQAQLGLSITGSKIESSNGVNGTRAAAPSDNPYLAHLRKEEVDDTVSSQAGYDDRFSEKKSRQARAAAGLQFNDVGKYVDMGNMMRAREQRSSKRSSRYSSSTGDGVSLVVAAAPTGDARPEPLMEWWDVAFLPKDQRPGAKKGQESACDFKLLSLTQQKTHMYVQHPIPLAPLRSPPQAKPVPVYLTKRDRKRIRRQERMERNQERNEKVALGLLPPPEPKVRIANLMRVLKDDAVADPSKIEAKVRKQIEQRKKNHEMRNAARKLTPEERRAKALKKYNEDAAGDIVVALFRVQNLTTPEDVAERHQFKIDINAHDNYLSGCAVIVNNAGGEHDHSPSMVLVEGGKKAVGRFTKLMLRRIKWTKASLEDYDLDDEEEDDSDSGDDDMADLSKKTAKNNWCALVWKGVVPKKNFNGMLFQECNSARGARNFLKSRGLAYYWDTVANFKKKQ